MIFDPAFDAKLVSKSAASDVVASSAVNFYGRGLTQADVAEFYAGRLAPNDAAPVSLGLNSTLERSAAGPVERVWKVGGRYTEALEEVVRWLEKACARRRERRAARRAREARRVSIAAATCATGTTTTSRGSRTRIRSST